jgi:hypothetical protein
MCYGHRFLGNSTDREANLMVRKLMTMVAAAALAAGATAAQAAAPLSLAQSSEVRMGASMGDASDLRGSSAPVVLGIILIVLFIAVVTGDSRGEPGPNSP